MHTPSAEAAALADLFDSGVRAAASDVAVRRTHRVVRAQATHLQARRSRVRSLYLPVAVSAVLVAAAVLAVWSVLGQNSLDELMPGNLPDAAQQLAILSMWCLPVTLAVLAVVSMRRADPRPASSRRTVGDAR